MTDRVRSPGRELTGLEIEMIGHRGQDDSCPCLYQGAKESGDLKIGSQAAADSLEWGVTGCGVVTSGLETEVNPVNIRPNNSKNSRLESASFSHFPGTRPLPERHWGAIRRATRSRCSGGGDRLSDELTVQNSKR